MDSLVRLILVVCLFLFLCACKTVTVHGPLYGAGAASADGKTIVTHPKTGEKHIFIER